MVAKQGDEKGLPVILGSCVAMATLPPSNDLEKGLRAKERDRRRQVDKENDTGLGQIVEGGEGVARPIEPLYPWDMGISLFQSPKPITKKIIMQVVFKVLIKIHHYVQLHIAKCVNKNDFVKKI